MPNKKSNMNKKFPIDLIIFDFDGTLTDSIPSALFAIQQMLKELNFPHKTVEELNQFVGFGEIPLVEGAIGTKKPDLVKQALQVYGQKYHDEGLVKVPLFPNVIEFLEGVKKKKLVILSNKRDAFIINISERLGIKKYFKEIYGGDTSPCLKPDPCVVFLILKKYEVRPERVLFVGDMAVDIQTAKNAGVVSCGVTYGFDGKDKLLRENPDILVDDMLQIKDYIE
jgi:phosphoglycolate phosphatase